MRLNADKPRNSPNRPPQAARKSVGVYTAERLCVSTTESSNEMVISDGSYLIKSNDHND